MDIQKEREAFESWWEAFHNGRQIACDYVEEDNSYSVGYANAQWVAWQAKAQVVPDLGELQERIAGHQYYHDEHGHMIVDMDDVVKEISGFDSWKAQAVPEGFVVCKSEPVAYIVQNKFWKQKFDVKSVKDMPPQKWEDDHYDVEIPLYAVSLDGLVLKEQDEDEAND